MSKTKNYDVLADERSRHWLSAPVGKLSLADVEKDPLACAVVALLRTRLSLTSDMKQIASNIARDLGLHEDSVFYLAHQRIEDDVPERDRNWYWRSTAYREVCASIERLRRDHPEVDGETVIIAVAVELQRSEKGIRACIMNWELTHGINYKI